MMKFDLSAHVPKSVYIFLNHFTAHSRWVGTDEVVKPPSFELKDFRLKTLLRVVPGNNCSFSAEPSRGGLVKLSRYYQIVRLGHYI